MLYVSSFWVVRWCVCICFKMFIKTCRWNALYSGGHIWGMSTTSSESRSSEKSKSSSTAMSNWTRIIKMAAKVWNLSKLQALMTVLYVNNYFSFAFLYVDNNYNKSVCVCLLHFINVYVFRWLAHLLVVVVLCFSIHGIRISFLIKRASSHIVDCNISAFQVD